MRRASPRRRNSTVNTNRETLCWRATVAAFFSTLLDMTSGNLDLAPTVFQILGVKSPQKMDGTILSEAMTGVTALQERETKAIEATKHFRSGTWRQSLQISRVGSTLYFDEGNGAFVV